MRVSGRFIEKATGVGIGLFYLTALAFCLGFYWVLYSWVSNYINIQKIFIFLSIAFPFALVELAERESKKEERRKK